jgi:hypothetical protein
MVREDCPKNPYRKGISVTDDRAKADGGAVPDSIAGTGIDTSVPHSARIWNYWLGGKDNISQVVPVTPVSASLVSV